MVPLARSPLALLSRSVFAARYSTADPWRGLVDALDDTARRFPRTVETIRRQNAFGTDVPPRERREERWKLFEPCQIIRPHDLTYKARVIAPRSHFIARNIVAPPTKVAREKDIFYQLDVDPLSQSMNPAACSRYVSEMGKILNRSVTLLTSKNQRKMAKAIKRARMMGVIPILSRRKAALEGKIDF